MCRVNDAEPRVELPQAFARAIAYPHPVQEIQVIETHISWVFLTDLFAYKVKRPVNLGFVDFTTLESRRRSCALETQLNRRYARDLYLGVLPIYQGRSGPSLAARGPVVDHAVVMWRFASDDLALRRLQDGRLPPEDLEALAGTLAAFHEVAARAPETSVYGAPFEVLKETNDSLRLLERKADLAHCEAFQKVSQWTQEASPDHAETFERRRSHGHVREGHGDLHLENIVYWDGRLTPFDGIEFNDLFRWIDTVSDAAFLAMDLTCRGAPERAHRFLNAYFETSRDYHGLRTLRWYWIHRALIRAKIAAINARDAKPPVASQYRDEMARYLRHAAQTTERGAPRLWITFGPSGGGKSTRALEIVETQGAFRLRSDVERKRWRTGAHPAAPFTEEIYTPEWSRRIYEHLRDTAEIILRAGESVVVDATFLQRAQREAFRRLAEQTGSAFHILDCSHASEEILVERLIRRQAAGTDPSEATPEVLKSQLNHIEPLEPQEQALVWKATVCQ